MVSCPTSCGIPCILLLFDSVATFFKVLGLAHRNSWSATFPVHLSATQKQDASVSCWNHTSERSTCAFMLSWRVVLV